MLEAARSAKAGGADIVVGYVEPHGRVETERLLETLTPREATVIRMRFGLDGSGEHSLEQVGERFGVTRERIRQIEAKALRKLKHPSRSRISQKLPP